MNLVNPPNILTKLTQRNFIWKIFTDKPVIYLTFDDGPIPEITPFILKTLDEFHAKATFFCVGENVKKHPEIYSEIVRSGHKTGNHTFNHLNGWKTHSVKYIDNINKCTDYFSSDLFRPPYGKLKPSQLRKIKKEFSVVLWTVLSYDFDQQVSKEDCLNNVLTYTDNGAVVVFHDNLKAKNNLFYSLPRFLDFFTKKGYKFEILTKEICQTNLSRRLKIFKQAASYSFK